ncbi:MAG: hypothetical protein HY326_10450 [Chloroflexi bacterium]|nr:hypothetical protein [Chloroflexota bacterium]
MRREPENFSGVWRRSSEKGRPHSQLEPGSYSIILTSLLGYDILAYVNELTPFIPLAEAENQTVAVAAQQYGTFLGLPVVLAMRD